MHREKMQPWIVVDVDFTQWRQVRTTKVQKGYWYHVDGTTSWIKPRAKHWQNVLTRKTKHWSRGTTFANFSAEETYLWCEITTAGGEKKLTNLRTKVQVDCALDAPTGPAAKRARHA